MKHFLFFCLLLLLMVSCRTNDHQVDFIRYDTTGFHTVVDHSVVGEILRPGDTVWAHTVATVDTMLHCKANTREQWGYARRHGDVAVIGIFSILLILGLIWFVKRNNSGNATTATVMTMLVIMAICCGVIGIALGWWDGYSADIKKPLYDSLMRSDGDLHRFFDKQLK